MRRYVGPLYFATRAAGYTTRITGSCHFILSAAAPENGAEAAAGWFDKTHVPALLARAVTPKPLQTGDT